MHDTFLDRLVGEIRSRGMITPGLMYEDPCRLEELPGQGTIAEDHYYRIEDEPEEIFYATHATAYKNRKRKGLTGKVIRVLK